MLAKMTSKNQITLPKKAVDALGVTGYFDVRVEDDRIILTPVRVQRATAVREKLEQLGLTEKDVAQATAWARKK